ncbi:MAG TPA: acyltransferase family protein [Flexivirga sp.]|uniref:acyltransferase family protein n=1 Tax=Flexivirga sp. TaxID=1962927 RepID=UPI002CC26EA5|nr:acyltransferase family protein [Flexivirga sp.]HWC21952.1 acyltransferase family protein [Flexivirga sp.]
MMAHATTRSTPSRHYLPAIDGVRGIGVLIVLLYHAGWTILGGAFLAIDMFFALSGFLITALLLRQYDRWGTVPLLQFWSARARRLLPAMTGVVLLAGVYAKFFADPTVLGRFRMDMVSAMTFWSNWHFIHDRQSYFETGTTVSPLLHTWSLGIEEQFYLVWPVLLLGWMVVRRGRLRGLPTVLAALAVGSAVLMAVMYQPYSDPSNVYYSTFTRAQALLCGCLLAVLLEQQNRRRAVRRRRSMPVLFGVPIRTSSLSAVAACIGIGWLVLAPLFVDDESQWVFRGGFLVSGVTSIGIGWHLVTCRNGRISAILGWRPLAEIGKRVYGLYIWHWPIFLMLDHERTHLDGIVLLAVRLIVVFVVAFAFDWFVERPVRRGALRKLVPHGGVIATAVALALGLSCAFVSTADAKDPIFGTALPGSISTVTGPMRPGQSRVDIFGDSVGFTLWKYFPTAQLRDLSVGSSTQLGCGLAMPQELQVGSFRTAPEPQCEHWEQRWSALVKETRPRLSIIVSGSAELYDRWVKGKLLRVGSPQWRTYLAAAYGRAVDVAGQHGRYPVTIANIPCYNREVTTGADALPGANPDESAAASKAQNSTARQQAVNAVLEQVAGTHPRTTLLDIRSYLCPDGKYQAQIDGVTMRPDGIHFAKEGTAAWWKHFAPELRKRFGPQVPSNQISQ